MMEVCGGRRGGGPSLRIVGRPVLVSATARGTGRSSRWRTSFASGGHRGRGLVSSCHLPIWVLLGALWAY